MNFFENITFRKKQRNSTEKSLNGTNASSTALDGSTSTIPDISADNNNFSIQQLKLQIDDLTAKLNAAHEEINCLSLENNELKKSLSKIQPNDPRLTKPLNCSSEITPLKQQSEPVQSTSTPLKRSSTLPNSTQPTQQLKKPNKKRKLCILSNNNNNKILSIAEDSFPNYEICHYLTPNCGIKKLITNLEQKLSNYTKNDYCVILVGEEDFRRTKNYIELTISIRETLLKIQNTNVILCAPTFKLNNYSEMFNGRIETFNSLLYLDACTYNFAYLFDSNYCLSYDFQMFWKQTGSVNNYGMSYIFFNLRLMIDELTSCNNSNIISLNCAELKNNPNESLEHVNNFFLLQSHTDSASKHSGAS